MYRGADKSLARPRRKQATATILLQATQKNSEDCPSDQVSAAAMTCASDEKWRPFNSFFQSGRAKDLSAPLYNANAETDVKTACLPVMAVSEPKGGRLFVVSLSESKLNKRRLADRSAR